MPAKYQTMINNIKELKNQRKAIFIVLAILWHMAFLYRESVFKVFGLRELTGYKPIGLIMLALLMVVLFAPLNTSPFIYFQF